MCFLNSAPKNYLQMEKKWYSFWYGFGVGLNLFCQLAKYSKLGEKLCDKPFQANLKVENDAVKALYSKQRSIMTQKRDMCIFI